MNKLKFLFPLIGLIAGVYISFDIFTSLLFPAVTLALALLSWIFITLKSHNPLAGIKYSPLHVIWVILLFMSLGSLDVYFRAYPYVGQDIDKKNVKIEGEITEIRSLADGDRLQLNVKSLKDNRNNEISFRNISFLVKTDGIVASKGDIIRFQGVPEKAGTRKSIKNTSYFMHQGISYFVNIKSDNIELIGKANSITTYASTLRDNLTILIEKSSLERSTGEFLISIILGDKTLLSDDTRQTLNSAGMAHVLALSGMHIAIVMGILFWILFPFSLIGQMKARRIIALSLLWAYVLLTGSSPSTVRAAIMATMVAGAYIIERKNSALNALMVAAFLIILFSPNSLWNPGFQMSFLCVLSILLFLETLNPIDHHSHPRTHKIISLLLTTFITSFFTWTLTAYYFKNLPLLFLPVNFVLLPLLPVYFLLGSLYILLLTFGVDFQLLAHILDTFHQLYIGTASSLSANGAATLDLSITILGVFSWLSAMIIIAITLKISDKRKKIILSCLSILLMLIPIGETFLSKESDDLRTLKFKHSFTAIEAQLKEGDNLAELHFPRGSISTFQKDDLKVISIDAEINPDSLANFAIEKETDHGFIIMGSGASIEQIAEILNNYNYENLILHSGLGKNKKEELLRLSKEENLHKIYSLRDSGSLELDL